MAKFISGFHAALRGFGGLALFVTIYTQTVFASNSNPERTVTNLHQALISIMREADTLGYKGRFKHLKPHIEKNFHLPIMLRISVGNFWRKASLSQQERLVKVFTDISIGTYAARFSGYAGQTFLITGSRQGPQNTILVETTLRNPSGSDVPLTYVTREIQGTWRIIDILLSTGISELAVRRSEYRQTLKSGGIEELISRLANKLEDLRSLN